MMRFPTTAIAGLTFCALSASSLKSQVYINEVEFTATQQWIELYNDGGTDIDLGTWSIYLATKTPNLPNNYWWPFPVGTVIESKDYLRINWAQDITSTDPKIIDTGRSNFHFLFGTGFETLDAAQGALAICKTQVNTEVNSANIFEDWIQWGDTGFKREILATSNQPTALWTANNQIDPVPAGKTLIRIEDADSLPHPLTAFGFDSSPTPLGPNATNILINIYGGSCSWNHPNPRGTRIRLNGTPYHGNSDFSITIENTLGPAFFERIFYIIRANGLTQNYLFCTDVVLDSAGALTTAFFATGNAETTLNLPLELASAKGTTFFFQSVSFSSNHFSFSDRMELRISQ